MRSFDSLTLASVGKISLKNKLNIFIHIAVWAVVFTLPFFANPPTHPRFAAPETTPFRLLNASFSIVIAGMFYLNMYVLIPKVLNPKGWRFFLLSIAGCYAILALFVDFVIAILTPVFPGSVAPPLIFFTILFFFSTAISTSIRLSLDSVKLNTQLKERENENLKSELSLLRSQVSPHFMFNVLNSLASLARKRSDQMEFVIIQLSKLMRYMLYDTDDEKITVEKELEYLNSYINLQLLRFGNDVEVRFKTSFEKSNVPIEPMLLIPFVENAFKHGIGMIVQPVIEIKFLTNAQGISFAVRNKVSLMNLNAKDGNSGIGLTNLKRRLGLMYRGQHEIKTFITEDHWHVAELKITI
jgi:two-component system LytT family sensor kinase